MTSKYFDDCVSCGRSRANDEEHFNLEKQLELCAKQLKQIRSALGKDWVKLSDKDQTFANKSETKKLVKHLIRICSESVDFYATVDFITKDASTILKNCAKVGGPRKAHLTQWDKLSHEHMVPCEAVLIELTKKDADILEVLKDLSFRALVTGPRREGTNNEVTRLDENYRSILPPNMKFVKKGIMKLVDIDRRFYSLLRYEKVKMIDDLIPISARAGELLKDYKKFRNNED
jgi:hypothetical protein